MRYKCTVSYDGSGFYGFQRQKNQRSVQEELERAISIITKTKVNIFASGRTDAGVHAIGQVFHFDTYLILKENTLKITINRRLPRDIMITKVEKVTQAFHSRYTAQFKTYDFYFDIGEYDPLHQRYRYYYSEEVDIKKMIEASKIFIGTHDFRSFAKNSGIVNKIRTIKSIDFYQEGSLYRVRFYGNGFLYNMIRIIMAMLFEVGRGKITIKELKRRLEAKNRELAPKILPPNGLFLVSVEYPEEVHQMDPDDEKRVMFLNDFE